MRHVAPRSARHRCSRTRWARLNRMGTGVVGIRESVRVFPHRDHGRRFIHATDISFRASHALRKAFK